MGHDLKINHWADELPRLAKATADFFRDADNAEKVGVFDLDPRSGHVRLGETKVTGPLRAYASSIRGLMNDKGDLQAILCLDQNTTILTISDGGHTICRQRQHQCETFRIAPLFPQTA